MKNIKNKRKVSKKKELLNKLKDIFNITKNYFKRRKLEFISLWEISVLLIISILTISSSLASLTPVKSVEIFSEKLNYQNNEEGAWKVTKSSYWTDQGMAKITFDLDSVLRPKIRKVDVVLVLDTSASMVETRLNQVKIGTKQLITSLLNLDEENKIALISFNTTSTILSNFTRDNDLLSEQIDSLIPEGNTNYYQALNNVDDVLSNYTSSSDRKCVVVFLTDGYPNEDTPNEIGKAKELKSKYPYITINSISYEMGEASGTSLNSISDNITIAGSNYNDTNIGIMNVKDAFYYAAIGLVPYSSFTIEDYINNEYFDIIKATEASGSVNILEEDGNSKVVWDLGNGYLSGTSTKLDIEIKLKDEYLNTAGVFQTNIKEIITSTIEEDKENVTSTLTPIIADNYVVIYDGNAPADCTVDAIPKTENHSVFTTVAISDETPTCSGYKFKGWKVTGENIKTMGSDYFVMPEKNVEVKAEWARLKLKKTMKGAITEVKPLYDVIAANSVPDNVASEFVKSSTGINFSNISSDTNGKGIYQMASSANDEYPIYYYRGAVENNNVKFADFCWKIVRTTDTGGVKLIYNGLPDSNGGCTNTTGEATTIGQSAFNLNGNSLADVGYMYGTRYISNDYNMSWYSLAGKSSQYKGSISSTSYYYSDSVSYDEITGKYTLTDATQYLWSSNYSSMVGKYTCLSESETSCETVKNVVNSYSSSMSYVELSGGETYDSIVELLNNTKWIYGNDVEFKDTDGDGVSEYVLVDTYESAPGKWSDEYSIISSRYHYTCFSGNNTCEHIYYINYMRTTAASYVTLSEGKSVDDVVKEMLNESSNENDSTIKKFIDNWYKNNLIGFTDQLEDTEWCNDRSIYKYGGWDKDSKATYLYFGSKDGSISHSLSCNLNDSFTVEKVYRKGLQVGNGDLTYPIALLNFKEAELGGLPGIYDTNSYLYNGFFCWLLSFTEHADVYPRLSLYYTSLNSFYAHYSSSSLYVRPSISLKSGTKALSGDGTANNPYAIGKYYSITVTGNDDIQTNASEAVAGQKVTLISNSLDIDSFKINGEVVNGSSFIMPANSVEISDVVFKEYATVESEHNPYPYGMTSGTVYGEKTFEGATSLTVTLEYQTYTPSWDYITLYDNATSTTPINNKKYGGSTRTTETITVNGNYIKIVFTTASYSISRDNYYGFKATITPNY